MHPRGELFSCRDKNADVTSLSMQWEDCLVAVFQQEKCLDNTVKNHETTKFWWTRGSSIIWSVMAWLITHKNCESFSNGTTDIALKSQWEILRKTAWLGMPDLVWLGWSIWHIKMHGFCIYQGRGWSPLHSLAHLRSQVLEKSFWCVK